MVSVDKKITRVLMISEHADPLAPPGAKETGGQNVYLYHLAKELSKRGMYVDVYTRWDKGNKNEVVRFAKRARVIRVVSGSKHYIPRDHLFKYLPDFVDGIVAFKNKNKLAYDLIHSHYWMSGWSGLKLSELWHIPLTTTYHSLGYVRYHTLRRYKEQTFDSKFFQFRVEWEKILSQNASVIATSPFEKNDLIKHYNASAQNVTVIPAGIDLRMFRRVHRSTARKRIGLDAQAITIMYAGRIEWRKGIATLLYSIPKLLQKNPNLKKNLKLLIVGRKSSGAERKEVERLKSIILALKIQKYIHFVGSKNRTEMKYYYSAADVCAVPSYYEPFGLVPLEAFSCQCPVVASKVGGLQYTIHHDKTGLLVPPRDPDALARAMDDVIQNRSKYVSEISKFSNNELKHEFSWEAVAKEMVAYYDKLIKEDHTYHHSFTEPKLVSK